MIADSKLLLPDLTVEAISSNITGQTPGDVLSGARIARGENGRVAFNDTFARAKNGTYSLQFVSQAQQGADTVKSEVVEFLIRDCVIGESRSDVACIPCSDGLFSLIPDTQCHPCPEDAVCRGGASVIPQDTYWHSTPFSPEIHKCLVDVACKYTLRMDRLHEFFGSVQELRVNVTQDEYPQCNTVRFCAVHEVS